MANNNSPNKEVTSQGRQLSNGNVDGTVYGQSASDTIAFYGKVPYAQKVPTVGLNSSYVGALTTGTGTASSWGAQIVSSNISATTWGITSAVSGTLGAATTNMGPVLTEVVNTLVGLGLWKAASA